MKLRILFIVALVVITSVGLAVYAQKTRSCLEKDFDATNRIERVKGKVTILNHPTLGKTAGGGSYLIFRREGCDDCLVATHANGEGNYEIFLGIGRYKLIVQDGRCEVSGAGCNCYNMLAADQPEYLDVKKGQPNGVDFNIRLTLAK